jgi:(1->4)-alpha-D-glucan 1-alpha-D-glucosylmutase
VPTASYRVQLNAAFTLDDARALVPYLARLGVAQLYASPILAARPGSTHGYDVVDPRTVNPELGGEEALRRLARTLREHGMGLTLDIVPNHMGTGAHNPFWDDVLARGPASRYAHWFDIDWRGPPRARRDRLFLPVLGDAVDAVLARDELRVVLEDGQLRVAYFDQRFPLAPATVHRLLAFTHEYAFPAADGEATADAVRAVRDRLLPERGRAHDDDEAAGAVSALLALVDRSPAARAYLDWLLPLFSAGDDGRYRLRALLDVQHYLLAHWREGPAGLNYRRFFDVNDLAALRAEVPDVFAETHARVLEWVGDGTVDALRVDHVDGLADPLAYLRALRAGCEARRPDTRTPIFVEKILSPGESLRSEWPVEGTTGYEFGNDLEALFIDPAGAAAIERGYQRLVRGAARAGFHAAARRGKGEVLRSALAPDVARLARALEASLPAPARRDAGARAALVRALEAMLVALPVYRTYVAAPGGATDPAAPPLHATADDRRWIDAALAEARDSGGADPALLERIAALLAGDLPGGEAAAFVARFQQTSGPATAKGIEDTALYRYVPLASRNEVGCEPGAVPADPAATLHAANAERARHWPRHMLSVTTHDSKRSGDVRARLDVLSEMPDAWLDQVARWTRRHRALKARLGSRRAPDANTEYLLYQTVLGVWPAGGDGEPSAAALAVLADRVEGYMLKAAREAKLQTSWTDPRPEFEQALGAFVRALVAGPEGAAFRDELGTLVARVAPAACWNAAARTLVHLTAPGTPDLYQGDELWNHALVDPDNRNPVDYAAREAELGRLEAALSAPGGRGALAAELAADPRRQTLKLFLVRAALAARRRYPACFDDGAYEPIAVRGAGAHHWFAFGRTHASAAAVVLVPRLALTAGEAGAAARGWHPRHWPEATLTLPASTESAKLEDALTGNPVQADADRTVRVGTLPGPLPLVLLVGARG